MGDRTIRLFPQKQGPPLGLMPVPALQKPGVYELELLDAKGAVIKKRTINVVSAHFPSQNIVISKQLSTLKPAEGEQDTFKKFNSTVTGERFWTEPFQLPVPGCMGSPFGVRRLHNGKPTGDYHAGLDQHGQAGTPIHAITGGTVRVAGMFQLRGGAVGIDHGQGVGSIYMHMSKVIAREGDVVKPGDVIGLVGATGRATGPHLHWSVNVYGVPVNPRQWVKPAVCK